MWTTNNQVVRCVYDQVWDSAMVVIEAKYEESKWDLKFVIVPYRRAMS